MPTCDPRDVNAFGMVPPWEDLAAATCGELLTLQQQNERCADGGEYFVPVCPVVLDTGASYEFSATCGASGEAECNSRPFVADGSDVGAGVSPACVDICPNIR